MKTDYENMWDFEVVVTSDMPDINRVHPMVQSSADALYRAFVKDANIRLFAIFGSGVDIACNLHSDLDVYIETADTDKRIELPYDELKVEIDLLRDLRHDSSLYDRIASTALVVFER